MIFDKPLEEVAASRKSVRTYENRPLPDGTLHELERYMEGLSNPFGGSVRFRLLKSGASAGGEKLGTYGMIKGASYFFGAAAKPSDFSLEALGYAFEQLILFASSKGLGTCWLGGSFQKSRFAAAMHVGCGELFPAVSPVGYPAEKRRAAENLMRKAVGADRRKPWSELFFDEAFGRPLSPEKAGKYKMPLELVRLAPSASNLQPWRIVRSGSCWHFFQQKHSALGFAFPYDIQRIDIGIAACHFHLAALELGLKGAFVRHESPPEGSEQTRYFMTWKEDRKM